MHLYRNCIMRPTLAWLPLTYSSIKKTGIDWNWGKEDEKIYKCTGNWWESSLCALNHTKWHGWSSKSKKKKKESDKHQGRLELKRKKKHFLSSSKKYVFYLAVYLPTHAWHLNGFAFSVYLFFYIENVWMEIVRSWSNVTNWKEL